MKTGYDVVVVGAGTAGVIAAIQAGRAGAATLLVEKTGIAGGTLVSAGISSPSSFFAHGRQIIAGIGWELCQQAREELGEPMPDPATGPDWMRAGGIMDVAVQPGVFAALADERLLQAGVDILYHAMPAAARRTDDQWILTLCTKTGLHDVRAGVLVDCTGDANVVTLAGLDVVRSAALQAATLVVRVTGYDAETLDYAAIQAAFECEVAAGRMRRTDPGWDQGRMEFFLRSYGGNRIHVPDIDAHTSEGKTQAEIAGRQAMLRLLRFCRRQPGLGDFRIEFCAIECGIRESVTIKGRQTIGITDYESGRLWENAVCHAFYPVDIHRADHIDYRMIKPGVLPSIPLGAMLPREGRGIIVAGRCVAGDQEANSSYRVEASCMAMGQAAGAAAALAAQLKVDVADVPLNPLRALLREHGAIVPGDML